MLFNKFSKMGALLLIMAFAVMLGACPNDVGDDANLVPKQADYEFDGFDVVADGSPKEVSITPKPGASRGLVTIHYEGIQPTIHAKESGAPLAEGTYKVTFDVAAAGGWNARTGLNAGEVFIIRSAQSHAGILTPTADDFDISGHSAIYDGQPKAIKIKSKEGKSQGKITIYYETADGTIITSPDAPREKGSYTVTFDVAATTGWYAANGLSAETLEIGEQAPNPVQPTAAHFDIGTLAFTYDGNPKEVSITANNGNEGAITIWYTGVSYTKSETAPVNAGTYAVTFDVAEAYGFEEAFGLIAGDLVISPATPKAADFDIDGLDEPVFVGDAYEVSIEPKAGKSQGEITIYYDESETEPTAAGDYAVTFDVAASSDGNWNEATGLEAGTLTIRAKSSDASLASLTINGVSATFPASHPASAVPNSSTTVNFSTITMTNAQYSQNNTLIVLAEPNHPGAKVVGYAVTTTSSNITNTASWSTYGSYNAEGIVDGYTITGGLASGERIFVWVQAENGSTDGYYRINEITVTPDPPLYTVTFDKNGGDTDASPTTRTVTASGQAVALPTAPKWTGYIFSGWNTEANGSGTTFDATTPVTGNIEVFAQWSAGALSSDASLASLTINGVAATFPTTGHPNKGVTGSGKPGSLTVWNTEDYTTITMTAAQFNNGNPLTIEGTPNHPGARIVSYAATGSSSHLYNGSNIRYQTGGWVTGIASPEYLTAKGYIPNNEYTFTKFGTSSGGATTTTFTNNGTRIFVWVEAEDGTTWGFYRVNVITIQN